jgi:hypothetical protein
MLSYPPGRLDRAGDTWIARSGDKERAGNGPQAQKNNNWGYEALTVTSRLTTRIHAMLERHLPEQRLFLKSDDGTRFIRLRPATQAALITGMGLFVGWTIIVTSIFLIDTISAGNLREQAQREEMRVQDRLRELELAE